MKKAEKKLAPIHPGEILHEEFLLPLSITQYRLAKDLDVPRRRMNEIVQKKRGISADTALRLARYFGTSAEFWMNLQMRFDILSEERKKGKVITKRVSVYHAQERVTAA